MIPARSALPVSHPPRSKYEPARLQSTRLIREPRKLLHIRRSNRGNPVHGIPPGNIPREGIPHSGSPPPRGEAGYRANPFCISTHRDNLPDFCIAGSGRWKPFRDQSRRGLVSHRLRIQDLLFGSQD